MAYQKKYYFTFKQLGTNDVNLVEIWQDTDETLTAEEVTGALSPFITEISDLDHKFDVVIGRGCEVALLSTTDRKFLNGLYHVDAQEIMVKHYINGEINYLGYLNSEMYSEDYSSTTNYTISVTGNDGLSLASRYTFINDSEENYTGIKTEFEILMICLNKIGLPWDELRICLSTYIGEYYVDDDETVLHKTYVSCSNFYDEDDEPMTLKEVMESILQPYGAQIFILGDNIYIIDSHSKFEGINDNFATLPNFKRYDYDTETYLGTIEIDHHKVIQDIGYAGTGQSIEISGGVNKQTVAYSPYPDTDLLDESLTGEDEFSIVPETWIARQDYFYKELSGNSYWNLLSTDAAFESSYYDGTVNGESVEDGTNGYLRFVDNNSYDEVMELVSKPVITISSTPTITEEGEEITAEIVLTFDILLTFADSKVYRYMTKGGGTFDVLQIYFRANIGDYYYSKDGWEKDSSNLIIYRFVNYDRETWHTGEELRIPTTGLPGDLLLSGEFNITPLTNVESTDGSDRTVMIWMKEMSVTIENSNETSISDDDVEYIGKLDSRFAEEGDTITLTTGTDTYSTDRAKLMQLSLGEYYSIKQWTRNGETYKLEELLLNSVCSNYQKGFFQLTNLKLKHGFDFLSAITDNNISGKVFGVKSMKTDYEMNEVECDLWEMSPDVLDIVT